MKVKTMRLTVICQYCGLPKTYKTIEGKLKGANTMHLHTVCEAQQNLDKKLLKLIN